MAIAWELRWNLGYNIEHFNKLEEPAYVKTSAGKSDFRPWC